MQFETLKEVIGAKRVLEILVLLDEQETLHFSEIESHIETSSDVISAGLKTLVEYGLVSRDEKNSRNVQYTITKRGERFLARVAELESSLQS